MQKLEYYTALQSQSVGIMFMNTPTYLLYPKGQISLCDLGE